MIHYTLTISVVHSDSLYPALIKFKLQEITQCVKCKKLNCAFMVRPGEFTSVITGLQASESEVL